MYAGEDSRTVALEARTICDLVAATAGSPGTICHARSLYHLYPLRTRLLADGLGTLRIGRFEADY